ncbi:uncharacterized protein LOC117168288 [Belonocnema kinseyi]|uniref:uncharacterized protein LOC117168288 n=1 Tax=Belonocnema kinseyi TaxID=2817044 RepID=UPI00143D1471|nr:uncharacterized protein LOC117168288 [Belonocnema kinseyi]
MKVALFFSALLVASRADAENVSETIKNALADVSNGTVNKIFKKLLEELKGVIKHGSKFFGIPSMDPYETGPVNTTIKSEDIRANLSVLNIGIFGLSNYEVTKAEIKGISIISIGFDWPELKGNISSYDISHGRVMDFVNIFGNGDAVYKFKNLTFISDIFLQFKNKEASVKYMKSEVFLGGLEFYTDGLYDDKMISEKMSYVISEIGPTAIEMNQKELTDAINNRLINILNKFLRKFTVDELFDSVTGILPGIKRTIREEYDTVRDTIVSIIS